MLIFLDSSALVKYYLTERGSIWVRLAIATQEISNDNTDNRSAR